MSPTPRAGADVHPQETGGDSSRAGPTRRTGENRGIPGQRRERTEDQWYSRGHPSSDDRLSGSRLDPFIIIAMPNERPRLHCNKISMTRLVGSLWVSPLYHPLYL